MPEFTRIFDIIYYQNKLFPLEDCMARREDKQSWTKYTTQQIIKKINQLSYSLLKIGIKKEDKIAIIATTNRPEWHFVDLAVQQIGAITVPIYPTISKQEYEYIFNHASIKLLFISDKIIYRRIKDILPNISTLQQVFSFDEVESIKNIKELYKTNNNQVVDAIKNTIQPNDVATILYTSGTTGVPKGVMLTHNNIVSNVKGCLQLVTIFPKEKTLSFLPLSHVFERTINYTYLAAGASIYFADGLESIAENLQDIKPQYFTTVPRLLERVYEKIIKKSKELNVVKKALFNWALNLGTNLELGKEKTFFEQIELQLANQLVFDKWRNGLGGNIKAIVCGSAPLQPRLATIFTNAQIPVLEGYGLTECSPVVSVIPNQEKYYRAGCVGKVLPHLEVKIANDGEILVKGDSVMKGYYNNEEATKNTITTDNWLLTGDIGTFTKDGFLKITDRKKELFKTSGGKYVAPAPIENKIKESFFIEQIALIGDGEKFISALIVPNFDELKTWAKKQNISILDNIQLIKHQKVIELYQSIISKNNVNFGKVEQVKQFKLLIETWTVENGLLTATMKLKRKKIKEKFENIIQSIYNK